MSQSEPETGRDLHWETVRASFPWGWGFASLLAIALGTAIIVTITDNQQRLLYLRIVFWIASATLFGIAFLWQLDYKKARRAAGEAHNFSVTHLLGVFAACAIVVLIASFFVFPLGGTASAPPTQQLSPAPLVHNSPTPSDDAFKKWVRTAHTAGPVRVIVEPTQVPAVTLGVATPEPTIFAPPPKHPKRPTPTSIPTAQPTPLPRPAASIISTNQNGGTNNGVNNSGNVGTINQNLTPRQSKFIKELQPFYAQGQAILQTMGSPDLTDSDIDQAVNDGGDWSFRTWTWIKNNMGDVAAAKFQNTSGQFTYSYDPPNGSHITKAHDRDMLMNGIQKRLNNLEEIMNSVVFDPQ